MDISTIQWKEVKYKKICLPLLSFLFVFGCWGEEQVIFSVKKYFFSTDVETYFMPWLLEKVEGELNQSVVARTVLDGKHWRIFLYNKGLVFLTLPGQKHCQTVSNNSHHWGNLILSDFLLALWEWIEVDWRSSAILLLEFKI